MIQKKTTDVVVKYFANKEEVEKQVANNTKELETKLVEQQKLSKNIKIE